MQEVRSWEVQNAVQSAQHIVLYVWNIKVLGDPIFIQCVQKLFTFIAVQLLYEFCLSLPLLKTF